MKNIEKIFTSYDIRGISGEEITEEFAYAVANAFAQKKNLTTCVVSREVRKHSSQLQKHIMRGLRDAGCQVVDAGVTSTSQLKWIVAEKKFSGGIMITASHNPKEYNGFKFYLSEAIQYAKINGLHDLKDLLTSPITKGFGSIKKHDFTQEYVERLRECLPSSKKHVFIDASGGGACRELHVLVESGEYNFKLYNAQEDSEFRIHEPNPVKKTATQAARNYCAKHACIGCVLDADADRLILIDENGQVVPADFLLALLTKNLPRNAGVCATLNCSWAVKDFCAQNNIRFYRSAVGVANVQDLMIKHDLNLGGETSGHIMFKHVHGSEAPILCLLEVLKKYDNLAEAIRPIRDAYMGGNEQNYTVTNKQIVLDAALKEFADDGELDTLDGVFVETESWWLSIRQSNTEPVIRFTWEAKSQEDFSALKERVEEFVKPFLSNQKQAHNLFK